ncbi:MAG: hypothetical protein QM503_15585, partial [Bacteroidota bacterium]
MRKYSPLLLIFIFITGVLFAQQELRKIDKLTNHQTESLRVPKTVGLEVDTLADNYIYYGDKIVFNDFESNYCKLVVIDSLHFIVAYQDWGNNGYGTVKVGTISGVDIVYGDEVIFNAGVTKYISACSLNDSSFVIAFNDSDNNNSETVVLGTISSDYQIIFSAEYPYRNNGDFPVSIISLDSYFFIVTYHTNTQKLGAVIGTINNNSISYGPEFESSYNTMPSTVLNTFSIDSANFGVAYGGVNNGNIVMVAVSNSTISYSPKFIFNQGDTRYISATSSKNNSFVVVYADISNSNYGTAVMGNIEEGVVSFGPECIFNLSSATIHTSITCMDTAKIVIAYSDDDDNNMSGTAVVGIFTDDTINFGNEAVYKPGYTQYNSIASLNMNKFILAYEDDGNSYFGTSIIGYVSDYPVFRTIIDSAFLCGDTVVSTVRVTHLEGVKLFGLYLEYDTSNLLFVGCQNLNFKLDEGQILVTEDDGLILITWISPHEIDILNDTLFDLVFEGLPMYSQTNEYLVWDDFSSFYRNSTGSFIESLYFDGVITQPIIDKPLGPTIVDLNVTVSSKYTTNQINDTTIYQWNIHPVEAGEIVGNDTIGT